ncbi:hypothetical protein [Ensifer sp. NM-2]|nr:hypothetical protein [Ensifer sp. NM-2]
MIVEVAGTIGVAADIDASSALSKYTINAGNEWQEVSIRVLAAFP